MNPPGYHILGKLGKGGMGEVYLAEQIELERKVALKFILPDRTTETAIARFHRERKAVGQLNHRNIVTVHDSGIHQGRYYLAMEHVTGGSLHQRLQENGKLDPAEAIAIVRALAEALQYAHDKGLIHRDIKPENILLREDGTPVLSDFGLVKLLGQASSLSQAGGVYGTPHYMSPEQV